MLEIDPSEARLIAHYLRIAYDVERDRIGRLDEESDAYVEAANDLMRLEATIAKLRDRPRMVR